MRKSLLGALLICCAGVSAQAEEVKLKADHPQQYTVVKGDTLWDISGRFLSNPWVWPELWQANPQVQNPHLIFPGDQLSLVYVDGQPRLTVTERGSAGRTIVLGPNIKRTPIDDAIPPIPLSKIHSFLRNSRMISSPAELKGQPYVIATDQDRVAAGAREEIYARGSFPADVPAYGVYREGETFRDPKSNELLGTMLLEIGAGTVKSVADDVATIYLDRTNQEVRIGDALMKSEERPVSSSFQPSLPSKQDLAGQVLAVVGGVNQIGRYDNLLINLGARDGLIEGNVLSIDKTLLIQDRVANQMVELPPKRAGLLLIFRVFDKVSYGIVMEAYEPLSVGDTLSHP